MSKPDSLAKFLSQDEPWKDQAACRSDTAAYMQYFFPTRGQSKKVALELCASCPVRVQCDEYSKRTACEYGIWAGKIKKRTKEQLVMSEIEQDVLF